MPPKNLRRTISAIFWRHQNGAKWRALPSGFGPWWIAAQLFIRWSKLGAWQRLFEKVRDRDQALDMVFLDGTTIRAHHKAAGAAKKGSTENAERIVKLLATHVEGSSRLLPPRLGELQRPARMTVLVGQSGRPVLTNDEITANSSKPRGLRTLQVVENLWVRLKEWRAGATQYEKTAASFFSLILIAATADYIKT